MVDNCTKTRVFGLFKRLLASAAVLSALTLSATGASAITTTYINDEAGFLTAAGGGLTTESFESFTPNGAPVASIATPGFTLEDTGTGPFQDDLRTCPAGFCAGFAFPTDGSIYVHASGQITFNFNTAVNAVAFDVVNIQFQGVDLTTNVGDVFNNETVNIGANSLNFIGIVNDTTAFTSLTVNFTNHENSVAIDRVTFDNFAVVPEPGMMTIFGFGLVGLAISRRRKLTCA
ncbi:MAG: PEP-CTERM sorting domain-containing protein [Alphaproteobacteria bacterium]|nr:PEP-CTERM sorting domain-containing protein [Alphaproteobacteria bacterium]